MMSWLWPIRTGRTFFDVWSLVHFAFWFVVGSVPWSTKMSRPLALGLCLGGAYAWEVFERYAEKRWPNLWLNPESWQNAWISDPLMCMLGVLSVWYALDHWR